MNCPLMTPLLPLLLLSARALAQDALVPASEGTPDEATVAAAFADHLFEKGDYYRAIGEYERAMFLGPLAPERGRWELKACEALHRGEQSEDAGRCYDRAVERGAEGVKAPGLLGAARSWLAAKRPETAAARAAEAAEAFDPDPRTREAKYVEGWALLESGRDAEAAAAFRAARGAGITGENANRLLLVLPQLEHLPSRSPVLAGLLGVVPGAGHLYVGEYTAALSALVWNGIFGWAIWEAVDRRFWSIAAVLGIFETMWYGGSIVGAVSGAHRFNRDARLNAMDDLERIAPPEPAAELRSHGR